MNPRSEQRNLRIVGVALEGRDGMPVIVLAAGETEELLSLPVSLFDADMLVREFLDDEPLDDGAIGWLADSLMSRPPVSASIECDGESDCRIRFRSGRRSTSRDRFLAVGEGLVLALRLGIPVSSTNDVFAITRAETDWLSSKGSFTGDFLYLSPPQYAPGIPVE